MKQEITAYYNDLAKDYDENRFANSYGAYINKQEHEFLKKYLDQDDISLNLDLACGTGRFLDYADYGLDISDKMIEVSMGKYPNKNLQVGDAEKLDYSESYFNNILSFHLFMHLDLDVTQNILNETNRVIKRGGYFIFDMPSKKRRKLTNYKGASWHGANQLDVKTLKKMISPKWELISYHGIAFFPIHRIPKKIRSLMIRLDNLLCRSFFKEYSSYLIFVLKKK